MKKYLYIFFLLSFISLSTAFSQSDQWKQGILVDEFVYNTAPFPSVHAATIAETKSGLVTAFFGGQYEGHPEVSIYVSRLEKEGWTAPRRVVEGIVSDTLRKACYNPVLYQWPDDELVLFYKIGKNVQDWTGYLIRSFDDGKTWSTPEKLPEGYLGPIKNRPEMIGNKLICASSTEDNGWRVHFEFTEDKGKSWRKTKPINGKAWNMIQPSILQHRSGMLQVVCRSQEEHILSAFSVDQGETWSDPVALSVPNNNSGTDAITMADGRHLLVYNHVKAAQSAYKDLGRTPLNVALSEDGITWKASLLLEDSPISEYSYPSVIQSRDGAIHIVYTWRREKIKYVKIDPLQLNAVPMKDGIWPINQNKVTPQGVHFSEF